MTRAQLLAAGRRLFGDKGLYESRIEDLSSTAGIAKGTLYGYFESKEALVLEVVAMGFQELASNVASAAEGSTGGRRLEAIIAAHFRFYSANPDLMRIFHQVRGVLKFERPEWIELRVVLRRYVRTLASVLAGGGPVSRAQLDLAERMFGSISGMTSVRTALGLSFSDRAWRSASIRALTSLAAGTPAASSRRPARRPRRG